MEQTALRPKPLPGQEPTPAVGPRRPHAARRRGRRLTTLLLGGCLATVLVLCGIGVGALGTALVGTPALAGLYQRVGLTPPAPAQVPAAAALPAPSPRATLGLEAVDAAKAGAEIVAVHDPGPGRTAGLRRGDIVLTFGPHRVDSATDLAHAVDRTTPGTRTTLTVRHPSGGYRQLTVVPGVVT
ncbi:PDZ domain-containing protein [Streptomyces sp. NPDC086091]|uniref:PDZ domain-containing protein n=1 Tax=Streptomyces sp. NPDC086091 TaxID=3365751 RepID=UPI0038108B6A